MATYRLHVIYKLFVCSVIRYAKALILKSPKPVMVSRDLVSVWRLVSRPIFVSLGLEGFRSRLGLEVYRSRDFEYCKEMV